MRTVEILCNLEDLEYDATSKKYSFDSSAFDIEQPVSCNLSCSVVFDAKKAYVMVCSDELFSRKKVRQNSTKFGSTICMLDSKNVFEHTSTIVTSPSDESLQNLSADGLLWLDFSFLPNMLDDNNNSIPDTTAGTEVRSVISRFNNGLLFQANTDNGIVTADVGLTSGITSSASWSYIADFSSSNNPVETQTCSYHFLFKSNPTGAFGVLFQTSLLKLFNYNGVLQVKDNANNYLATNLNVLSNSDYYLLIKRYIDNGTTYFHFTLEKLNGTTNTQTTTVSPGGSNPSAAAWYVSTAQASMTEIMSHIFVLTGNDATKNSTVRDWMVAKYTGEGIEQQVGTYTYNLENEKRIEFKQHCQTVSKIDFSFRDESGALLTPTRGIVKLNFRV